MRSMKASNTQRHSHTGVMEHETNQRREMKSFNQLTFYDLLEPGMKGRKNSIKMGGNERSKSRTSRYTNFETQPYF
jgi:hypothetical protein